MILFYTATSLLAGAITCKLTYRLHKMMDVFLYPQELVFLTM